MLFSEVALLIYWQNVVENKRNCLLGSTTLLRGCEGSVKSGMWGIRVRAQYFAAGRCVLGFTILLGWYNLVVMTHPGRKTENTSWRLGEN